MRFVVVSCICLLAAAPVFSQTAKEYPDGHGGTVAFPLGDVSFADEAVSLDLGEKRGTANLDPTFALGVPDYRGVGDDSYTTLSCGGTLTLRFVDNALIDVEGPDLYVFEIGPAVEAMNLAISPDGVEWIEVGGISGGRADIDIAEYAEPGQVFHYVRLTDLAASCTGAWPGADVDAVGAIGAAIQFSLNGSVLFDTAKWDLKPEALAELNELAGKLAAYSRGSVVVEGHTDSVGSDADNQTLSENRARSVAEYLQARTELASFSFTSEGYGESRPTATNETDEGRAQNRRVDIVLIPGAE